MSDIATGTPGYTGSPGTTPGGPAPTGGTPGAHTEATETPGAQERAGEVAGAAKEQAGAVAGTAKEQAGAVAGTAAEQAKVVATDARQQAKKVVDQGRDQLRQQASDQSARAAGSLQDLSRQLRAMADGDGAPEGPVGDLARQAAEGIGRFATDLQDKDPQQLLADVKRFARERPALFVLGALGAGFAAGRLLSTVDTGALAQAAKQSMQDAGGGGDAQPAVGTAFDPQTGAPTGTAGALPAAGTTHPPRTEPLVAPGREGL